MAHDIRIGDVRGLGLMLGVEFDTPAHAEEVQWAAFQRGLLVLECGKSSVRMSPALTVSEAEMATALRIFGEAVETVVRQNGAVLVEAERAITTDHLTLLQPTNGPRNRWITSVGLRFDGGAVITSAPSTFVANR